MALKFVALLTAAPAAIAGAFKEAGEVFTELRAAVSGTKLPESIKGSLTAIANDGESALGGLVGLAGTELGQVAADGIEKITQIFTADVAKISPTTAGGTATALTIAGSAAIKQYGSALQTQISTLTAQAMAGIPPVTPAPAAKPPITQQAQ